MGEVSATGAKGLEFDPLNPHKSQDAIEHTVNTSSGRQRLAASMAYLASSKP